MCTCVRVEVAGSCGTTVRWSLLGRAGPSCTQVDWHTTTKACASPKGPDTSWCPLSTPKRAERVHKRLLVCLCELEKISQPHHHIHNGRKDVMTLNASCYYFTVSLFQVYIRFDLSSLTFQSFLFFTLFLFLTLVKQIKTGDLWSWRHRCRTFQNKSLMLKISCHRAALRLNVN